MAVMNNENATIAHAGVNKIRYPSLNSKDAVKAIAEFSTSHEKASLDFINNFLPRISGKEINVILYGQETGFMVLCNNNSEIIYREEYVPWSGEVYTNNGLVKEEARITLYKDILAEFRLREYELEGSFNADYPIIIGHEDKSPYELMLELIENRNLIKRSVFYKLSHPSNPPYIR